MSQMLEHMRLIRAKQAFTTRRIPLEAPHELLTEEDLADYTFRPGDLALARVESIGHHARIELRDGRRARLFEGDEIILPIGPRYAPDQYEAATPTALGPCHLAAAGGVAGQIESMHDRIIRPTEISLLGLLGAQGRWPINLRDYAIRRSHISATIPAIAVAGTAMNAGKTTAAAGLICGLTAAGLRVGAAKITGTGAGGDYWSFRDAGAATTLDFVDAGYVATYLAEPRELEDAAVSLLASLAAAGCEIAVVEISDGIAQRETAALLASLSFRRRVPRLVFAAREAAGAAHGVSQLRKLGYDVACVSGLITRSPLAARECAKAEPLVPCLGFEELSTPATAMDVAAISRSDVGTEFELELAS